jgi:hypothetical protein
LGFHINCVLTEKRAIHAYHVCHKGYSEVEADKAAAKKVCFI